MNTVDSPMVSVILITYNSARYVIEALESVRAQTWKNIELIVSDDGSSDHTVQLCSDWINDNKNRFFSTKLITVAQNTGIASNCNRGLKEANGHWIKMIPGDDKLLRDALADNLEYARCFPEASFIFSDVVEIDEYGMLIREKVVNEALIFFSGLPSAKKQLKAYSRWPAFLNTPTFFCRKEIIEIVGYCDEEFRIYEDMTMLIRVMEKDIKLYYMEIPTVAYRVHRNAISRNDKIDEFRQREGFHVFRKYRTRHLDLFNPLDLSIYYESWLRFKYKGFNGRKGISILKKLSLFYWYLRLNGVRSY